MSAGLLSLLLPETKDSEMFDDIMELEGDDEGDNNLQKVQGGGKNSHASTNTKV